MFLALISNVAAGTNAPSNIVFILADDLGETNNVAGAHADIVHQMQEIFESAHQPSAAWSQRLAARRRHSYEQLSKSKESPILHCIKRQVRVSV